MLDDREVVADEQIGEAKPLAQFHEQVQHLRLDRDVERGDRLVEIAPAEELFARPNHPYTQALLAEVPTLDARRRTYKPIAGELPSPLDPPTGCAFHPRCPHAFARCTVERPAIEEVAAGHFSACHLNDG